MINMKHNKRKRGPDHPTGNATFFRADRFALDWEEHRSSPKQ